MNHCLFRQWFFCADNNNGSLKPDVPWRSFVPQDDKNELLHRTKERSCLLIGQRNLSCHPEERRISTYTFGWWKYFHLFIRLSSHFIAPVDCVRRMFTSRSFVPQDDQNELLHRTKERSCLLNGQRNLSCHPEERRISTQASGERNLIGVLSAHLPFKEIILT